MVIFLVRIIVANSLLYSFDMSTDDMRKLHAESLYKTNVIKDNEYISWDIEHSWQYSTKYQESNIFTKKIGK